MKGKFSILPVGRKRIRSNEMVDLSHEQDTFVRHALAGENILVDACIGSGKTTSIQHLCNQMEDKKILYLTYNKLLKLDAKRKIKRSNVTVTNYHGFACRLLYKQGISPSYIDSIQQVLKVHPEMPKYDVLIIDEYQDIEQELAELLQYVKKYNPGLQIIAVGDMAQKIYDKTALDVRDFILGLLGKHIEMEFTTCFRLSNDLAEMLGRIWKKQITGVNQSCSVEYMSKAEVIHLLSEKQPQDLLCLGSRHGTMVEVLNELEAVYPLKFNKKTVYASIRPSEGGSVEPGTTSAIFTTFDSSKGMERPICVVFDWTYSYWDSRINQPQQSFEILRNIFCVAASRGKEQIIFVSDSTDELLTEDDFVPVVGNRDFEPTILLSSMFDFKYKEDIENAYALLNIEQQTDSYDDSVALALKEKDELIDLLPCISLYQNASYFRKYNIDEEIKVFLQANQAYAKSYSDEIKAADIEQKILYFVSLLTRQERYRTQVELPIVEDYERELLHQRLSKLFSPDDDVQVKTSVPFYNSSKEKIFDAIGVADVVKGQAVYSLQYQATLSHVHFLVCASYMIALNLEIGIIYNSYDNSVFKIQIPSREDFLDAVTRTITKRKIERYYTEK